MPTIINRITKPFLIGIGVAIMLTCAMPMLPGGSGADIAHAATYKSMNNLTKSQLASLSHNLKGVLGLDSKIYSVAAQLDDKVYLGNNQSDLKAFIDAANSTYMELGNRPVSGLLSSAGKEASASRTMTKVSGRRVGAVPAVLCRQLQQKIERRR
jgi:hypothetical protein